MQFTADLHVHSRYARATSRDLNPENLYKWAALKGITVVGTGDFTHPAWFAELQEKLEPAEDGLYRLKNPWRQAVEHELPPACRREVRFLLSVEISSIYKKHGRTRKVHNLVMLPNLERAAEFNRRLGAIGNIKSDGRPILGLASHDLLALSLEVCPDVLFVPAHIWTPHFAVLGSESGFDSLEECFDDLLPAIFALETGLSSDPPMNSRLSALDRFAIISNSDAHSAHKLAREATCFDTELSYPAIYNALHDRDLQRFTGTVEFYPEEGKYHYDGHRKCQIRWKPAQTLQTDGRCPTCGGKLTVGVLHRVERLADRPEDEPAAIARPFAYIIPLPEVIGAALGVGPDSKKTLTVYRKLLEQFGPELGLLQTVPSDDIARSGEPLVAEAIQRMRAGTVEILAGYDGEYGTIRIFSPTERAHLHGQRALFAMSNALPARETPTPRATERAEPGPGQPRRAARVPQGSRARQATTPGALSAPQVEAAATALDEAQRQAVIAVRGPVVVLAGPGAGKTRTLTQRIAHLIQQEGVEGAAILAITFTKRAAAEMQQRLRALLPSVHLAALRIGTFHRMALELMRLYDSMPIKTLLDAWEARQLLERALQEAGLTQRAAAVQQAIALAKAAGQHPVDLSDNAQLQAAYQAYQAQLQAHQACDYDDILLDCLTWLDADTTATAALQQRFPHVLVDEFQDVNAVQYRLVTHLAGDGAGLFVIGDPDQAIYGFRGADAQYFQALRRDFPLAQVHHLATNYRSTQTIVQAAAAVIAHNPERQPFALHAAGSVGLPLQLYHTPSEIAEGIAVVRQISHMVGGADMIQADQHPDRPAQARSFGDFGVLVRTTQQAEVLEQCFVQEGVPYRLLGHTSFLEARRVRQALTWARYLLQPEHPLRLLQVIETPVCQLASPLLTALRQHIQTGVVELQALAAAVPAAASQLQSCMAATIHCLPYLNGPPEACFQYWRENYGDADDPMFERLLDLAARVATLQELCDTILLGQDADYESTRARRAAPAEAVAIMTLHAAKGLEFPVVALCGVEDGLLPLTTRGTNRAEERRLFYVGLTRAREEVLLFRARTRQRHGTRQPTVLSPFVRELPETLLVSTDVEVPRPEPRTTQLSLF
jgi:uncharacterized protein (TIGR00375 family)